MKYLFQQILRKSIICSKNRISLNWFKASKLALDNSDQFRTHNYVFNKMKINDKIL